MIMVRTASAGGEKRKGNSLQKEQSSWINYVTLDGFIFIWKNRTREREREREREKERKKERKKEERTNKQIKQFLLVDAVSSLIRAKKELEDYTEQANKQKWEEEVEEEEVEEEEEEEEEEEVKNDRGPCTL